MLVLRSPDLRRALVAVLAAFSAAVTPVSAADAGAPAAVAAGEAGSPPDVTMRAFSVVIAFQRDPGAGSRPSFPNVVRQLEGRLGAKFIGVQDDDEDVLRLRFIRQDGNVFNVDVDPYTMTPITGSPSGRRRKNY